MKRSAFIKSLLALPAVASLPRAAWAQAYPAKPVTLVVPYAPGGPTDGCMRIIAEELTKRLGQTFVVANRPGAASAIGAESVRIAPKDGYTMLMGTSTTFGLNPLLMKRLTYKLEDFEPVGGLARVVYGFSVSNKVPARNMQEFATWARAQPKGFTYGTPGQGTVTDIMASVLAKLVGAQSVGVHYKGSAPVQVDLGSGQLDASIDPLTTALGMHRAGKAKILAIVDSQRWPDLPEVPTLAEQGVNGVEGSSWLGLFAPAGTPAPIVAQVSKALAAVTAMPEVAVRLRAIGQVPISLESADLMKLVHRENAWWKKVVEEGGFKAE